jgi:hypothetical protein
MNKAVTSVCKLRACPQVNKRGIDLISEVLPFGGLWQRIMDPASVIAASERIVPCEAATERVNK